MIWFFVILAVFESAVLVALWITRAKSVDPETAAFAALPVAVQAEAARACAKVRRDPSFRKLEGSNLGREIRRDEAAEWTKLYLKDRGVTYSDSDVNLACELYYRLHIRKDQP